MRRISMPRNWRWPLEWYTWRALCVGQCKRVWSLEVLNQVKSKDDDSPVTVADWSVQATVSWMLSESFGSQNVSIIAEEDVQTLSQPDSAGLLETAVTTVNETLAKAPNFVLKGPGEALGPPQVYVFL